MTALVDASLFLVGLYLSMRVIAALYGVLDLWYRIGTAYPRVIRGILGWGGVTVVLGAALRGHARCALLWGLVAFLLFYLSLYLLRHLLIRKPAAV